MFLTHDERRISFIGGLTFTILTLAAGLSVFNIMQEQTKSILSKSLEIVLDNKVNLLEHQIEQGLLETQSATTRLFLIQHLQLAQIPSTKNKGLLGLKESAGGLLRANFSGVGIYDAEDNELINAGSVVQKSALTTHLETGSDTDAFLLWEGQFILRIFMSVFNQKNERIGRLMTEQYLPRLTETFIKSSLIGETGDFMLCSAIKESNLEMDCYLRGIDGNQFKRLPRIISNQPLPMHYALAGQRGIQFIKDYRQVSVVAAHSPVAYGLGTVLKIDEEELFYPIRKQISLVIFYLALLVLSGVLILYWAIMPLLRKIGQSDQEIKTTHTKLQTAEYHAAHVSEELAAYIDAIGMLALLSVTDRKGRILQANRKFSEISGYSEEELLGQDHRILNSGEHPKSFFIDMWSTIARGDTWHDEICNRNKNGKLYWVDSTIVPIEDKAGRITRYLSVRVDITARKQQHSALHERLKESICLHAVRQDLALKFSDKEISQRVLDHLIAAMQFPDICAGMIELNGKVVTAGKYDEKLSHKLSTNITINGQVQGKLHVFYTKTDRSFLPEEQVLLDIIGVDLARWFDRQETEQRIITMATHDSLTGLPNRRLLQDRIKQLLAHGSRIHSQIAILFIDLDHFKTINDSLGHDVGDLLLNEVAVRLVSCVRDEDTVARQGGDEFIVVLHSITDARDAAIVAEKILAKLEQPHQIRKQELRVGCSIGIAIFPENGADANTLLKNSDVAMYHAKTVGRNNFQFFTPEMNHLAIEKQTLGTDLHHALERNEMVLFYQPIINMPNQELNSMEVLLRWQHPKHGLISPAKFITLAEDTGLIIPIGAWVLKTACLQIKAWQEQGYDAPRLAINLSARQFKDQSLVENIVCILDESGVEAQHLTLEITESMLVDTVDSVVQTLNRLHDLGLGISIDDFGTGYSSLSYLKRFPITILKIDRLFVRDINTNSSDNAIVAAIIAMAKSLDIGVIAEGVETKEQLDLLIQHGCIRFQGYYFSKPLSTLEIENSLQKCRN
ncbi:MAG: EAL domain-containing protein [Nitrosomonas sp.]|nr:EAL domain-containing protein [Nitrosomonas sp.]MDP1949702.1 EAL domain-containing protein [Nitrosomonas sp.]